MKKYLVFMILFVSVLAGCQSDSKSASSNETSLQTLSGEFIYTDSVAVFKKKDGIYGVIMDAKAKTLIAQAKELNSDPFASFDVTLQASVQDNPEKDAWPELIKIKNIIKVQPSSSDDSLRLNK
ncbi:hypothetical protein [Psychroflexus tropicus]|uniref:hypothetical protein n=1 Tax=Psychroflexus tropicus TaxID=197345 RepID=UPI00052429F0|nr:hypothetical protein [Psychroflexus tropicus]